MSARRDGVTLVELLVVLTILSLIAALTAPAMNSQARRTDDEAQQLLRARQQALALGRPVTVMIVAGDLVTQATAMPDGSVLAASAANVDRATGRMHARR